MSKKEIKNIEILKYLIYNGIGIFMFFIPITIKGKSTIPLDHIASMITGTIPNVVLFYVLILMTYGGLKPILIDKNWLKTKTSLLFTLAKLLGAIIGYVFYFKIGPEAIFKPDMLPFLFNKLAISLGVVIPLGGAFIIFLIDYGLLEFMGIIMEKVMRPIFKTPGKSSIDAVASFVGSYSIGLLITNKVYKEGKYNLKEAAIIATGFSTVSATFMIVVAKTLGLIEMWNFYFWTCLIITFLVTALTVRIYPLSKKPETYYEGNQYVDEVYEEKSILKRALQAGLDSARKNKKSIGESFIKSYKDALIMTAGIVPSVLSIGLIGLLLAKYTMVFDVVGYIFYPFTKVLGYQEPLLVAKALATSIAEMFLPALLVTKADILTRYVIAVVSVSEILFFSASIPCILSTDIDIKITDLLIVWVQRVILSLILATIVGYIFL